MMQPCVIHRVATSVIVDISPFSDLWVIDRGASPGSRVELDAIAILALRKEAEPCRRFVCWGWILLLFIGCGGKNAEYFAEGQKAPAKAEKGAEQPAAEAQAPQKAGAENKGGERKIIYEGRVSLVVENFEEMETAIPDLVKQYDGYMAEANINRTEGRRRSGRWVARIPAERFADFLQAAAKLGIAEEQEQTAQDVTMEYLDLEARIATQKQLEQRILELLKNREGKLSDVIEAERELARVRSEIESMEGRLRYLKNRTSYSTVTINVREEQDYVPAAAPGFGGRIGKAWRESVQTLQDAGENLVIACVAVAPWILPVAIILWGLVFSWKRLRRPKPSTAGK